MRKKIALILTFILVLTAVLTGCGGSKSDAKAPVKKAADGFMSALAAGEFDKLSAFCTEEAFESEDLAAVEAVDKLDSSLLEALGVTEDLLSEETKESMAVCSANTKSNPGVKKLIINPMKAAIRNAQIMEGSHSFEKECREVR